MLVGLLEICEEDIVLKRLHIRKAVSQSFDTNLELSLGINTTITTRSRQNSKHGINNVQ